MTNPTTMNPFKTINPKAENSSVFWNANKYVVNKNVSLPMISTDMSESL